MASQPSQLNKSDIWHMPPLKNFLEYLSPMSSQPVNPKYATYPAWWILEKLGNCWKTTTVWKILALAIASQPSQLNKSEIWHMPPLKIFSSISRQCQVNQSTQNMLHTLLGEFSRNKATAEKQPLFEKI